MLKVVVHTGTKVMEAWPTPYCEELFEKLIAKGHRAFVVTDDLEDEKARSTIEGCDYFVGTPGKYLDMAKELQVKTVALLGPTLKGEGVKSPIVCAGCLDKIDPKPIDCFFGDELCAYEITANDVMEVLCS